MAKQKMLNVHMRVPVSLMVTLMELVQEAGVQLIEMRGVDEHEDNKAIDILPPPPRAYVGGIRNKGIKGEILALQTLNNNTRPMSTEEMSHVFVTHNFAGNSAASQLSLLKRRGLIDRDPITGLWSMAKKPKPATT